MSGRIQLGSCLFTLVDPHPGRERAYNEWYERDHFYAGMMTMPHVFAGRRWVATRALRELTGGGPGSFLATYWIEAGRHAEFLEAAVAALKELTAAGRMFDGRDHVHTGFYELASWAGREPDGVPTELALDHPFAGLVTALGGDEPPAAGAAALRLSWDPMATPGFDVPAEPLHLLFLDEAPAGCVEEWRASTARARWTRAFVPTVPGTTTHLDAL